MCQGKGHQHDTEGAPEHPPTQETQGGRLQGTRLNLKSAGSDLEHPLPKEEL